MSEPTDVYFEVVHERSHYFIDAKQTDTVYHLKTILGEIIKVSENGIVLYRFDTYGRKVPLRDEMTLGQVGFTTINSPCYAPSNLGLELPDLGPLAIADLSAPGSMSHIPPRRN